MKPARANRTRHPAARRLDVLLAIRAAAIAAIAMLVCPAAGAAEHLMVVQEVFPGTPAAPDAQYVMLRMTFQAQTVLNTHYISVEDSNGAMLGRFGTFDHNMGNGGAACSWPNCPAIVMGTAAAQTLFGFNLDQIVDAQAGRVALPLTGGRVCFRLSSNNSAMDCVAYGNYSASNTIPTPTNNGCDANFGTPAAVLVRGFALTRTLFNCAAKENSTDFTNRFPHPVANNGGNANMDADADQLINVLDACDADTQAWYGPTESLGLSVAPGAPTSVSWISQNATTGPVTRYDVIAGDLGEVRQFGDFTLADCMARDVNATSTADPDPDPLPGHARFYLVRARHCVAGTYGDSSIAPDPRDLLDSPTMGPCL
jgi:hypothetical protein